VVEAVATAGASAVSGGDPHLKRGATSMTAAIAVAATHSFTTAAAAGLELTWGQTFSLVVPLDRPFDAAVLQVQVNRCSSPAG
jgi:hypothetical protein